MKRWLIACECSAIVRDALRALDLPRPDVSEILAQAARVPKTGEIHRRDVGDLRASHTRRIRGLPPLKDPFFNPTVETRPHDPHECDAYDGRDGTDEYEWTRQSAKTLGIDDNERKT